MTAHDYLVLAIAAFWMVVGGLGLGFTIRRLHHQDGQQRPAVVGHDRLSAVRWQIPNIGGGIFDALAERRIGILGPVTAVVIAGLVAYALFLPSRHSAPEVRWKGLPLVRSSSGRSWGERPRPQTKQTLSKQSYPWSALRHGTCRRC